MKKIFACLILLGMSISASAQATPKSESAQMLHLAKIFSPNVVFQQNIPIVVWGKTQPYQQIRAWIDPVQKSMTVSDVEGNFLLRLAPLPGSLQAQTLLVENPATAEQVILAPVYIGEVYVLSGQSNMEYPLTGLSNFNAIAAAGGLDNRQINYLRIPVSAYPGKQREFTEAQWFTHEDQAQLRDFSGLGFLFAEELARRNPGVKIGLIEVARGGTGVECWIGREALLANTFWRQRVLDYDRELYRPEHYENLKPGQLLPEFYELIYRYIEKRFPEPLPMNELEKAMVQPDYDDSGFADMELPDSWTVAGHNHAGIFIYRYALTLTAEQLAYCRAHNAQVTLSLGTIDKGDECFINGAPVGNTGNGIDMNYFNIPRIYPVPLELLQAGKNVIAVRVASFISISMDGGFMGPAEAMYLQLGEDKIDLATEWKFKEIHDLGQEGSNFMASVGPGEPHAQSSLYNNLIYPLLGFGVRGVMWYQGEFNAIAQAGEYAEMLQTLITSWRRDWGQERLDFIIIGLPGFQLQRHFLPHSQWAKMREAQLTVARKLAVPVVISVDTGAEYDMHAPDKSAVAYRAAVLADELIKTGTFSTHSPYFLTAENGDANVLELKFEVFGSTLTPRDNIDAAVFMVRSDGKSEFERAQVPAIGKNTIRLQAPDRGEIVEVYYNWSNYPVVGVVNTRNLPLAPFHWVKSNG